MQLDAADDDSPTNVRDTLAGDGAVVAEFDRPRSDTPTTLAVVADPHVSTGETGTWKVFHRTRRRFEDTLAEVEADGVDCLVVAGDLTKDGAPADLDWVEEALASTDVPTVVVPGNHDVVEVDVTEFASRFESEGYPVVRRAGGVDVVGLNTAAIPAEEDPDSEGVEGVVSEAQLARLDERLAETADPIVVSHHNLPGVDATMADYEWAPHDPIGNAGALVDVLERHDVNLHLSGHVHLLSHAADRGVDALVAPALSSFPQAYLRVDIDADGTTVRCRTPADADGVAEAYEAARDGGTRSRAVSGVNTDLLASLPLVDRAAADDHAGQ